MTDRQDRPPMTIAERTAESLHYALMAINEAEQDVGCLEAEQVFELACATLRARSAIEEAFGTITTTIQAQQEDIWIDVLEARELAWADLVASATWQ
jgi:hypothetical protein